MQNKKRIVTVFIALIVGGSFCGGEHKRKEMVFQLDTRLLDTHLSEASNAKSGFAFGCLKLDFVKLAAIVENPYVSKRFSIKAIDKSEKVYALMRNGKNFLFFRLKEGGLAGLTHVQFYEGQDNALNGPMHAADGLARDDITWASCLAAVDEAHKEYLQDEPPSQMEKEPWEE